MTAAPHPAAGGDRPRAGRQVERSAAQVQAAQRLLEAPADQALQRLAGLAARLLGAPASQVSLLTEVQTTSVVAGQDPALVGSTAAPADPLCTVTAAGGAPLVVEDAAADARVAALPPVTSGAVGAYLGVPLLGHDGHVVGALCVFDPAPRTWSSTDVEVLTDLAGAAAAELELSALALEYESDRLRWQLAVAAGGVGGFDWDLRTGALAWDEQLLRMFGYERAGEGGREGEGGSGFDGTIEAFNARVHPEDLPRVGQALQQAIEECGTYEAEYRVVLPGGTTRWVKARGEAVAGADGRAVRVLGAAYDTTREHEDEVRTARVLESMSAAFYSLDHSWRFTYVNAEAEKLLQRRREELLGGVIWELFPDAVGADFETQYRRAVDTGQPVAFEAYYPPPLDGWYEIRGWPDPDGLSVYFLDVTVRRAAQQQAEAERAAAQDARRDAERTARRLALLASVSADLSETLDTQEAVARLAQHLVPTLGDWCIVTLVQDDGSLRDIGDWHEDEALRPVARDYRRVRMSCLDPAAPLHRALREDRPVVVGARATERLGAMLAEPARRLLRQLAPESAQMLPLRAHGRTVGLVTLFRGAHRPPPLEDDLLTASEVADRAGLALDNARLYAQQQHVAEGLQRALLTDPVQPDHLQIAVRYRPAA
ncbi:GAF domain-containing protein, partial [Kineococcus sp. SYSU DK006]|uniref:GAF domain-containing protein n=1 Tax=Kineococcus sp. SYSU DK006 TaxID=3383127 RepID=UPI003D7E30A9